MKINIKGVKYSVDFVNNVCDDNKNVVGSTCYSEKSIKLLNDVSFDNMCENISHELYHAFMYVCGLDDYCDDERLIHFLGRQYLCMLECFFDILSKRYPKLKKIKSFDKKVK